MDPSGPFIINAVCHFSWNGRYRDRSPPVRGNTRRPLALSEWQAGTLVAYTPLACLEQHFLLSAVPYSWSGGTRLSRPLRLSTTALSHCPIAASLAIAVSDAARRQAIGFTTTRAAALNHRRQPPSLRRTLTAVAAAGADKSQYWLIHTSKTQLGGCIRCGCRISFSSGCLTLLAPPLPASHGMRHWRWSRRELGVRAIGLSCP